ncbi:MAG: LuxR C-terminal-related transcriptional regulator [Streptosporangiaceae bacterium]
MTGRLWLGSLTVTERRITDLVAQGLSNRKVAGQTSLSTHTVAYHLRQESRHHLARVDGAHGRGAERPGRRRRRADLRLRQTGHTGSGRL